MRRRIALLIALVMLLVLPATKAKASNTTFEDKYNFIAYTLGDGVVHFRVLAWAEGGYNHWAINRTENPFGTVKWSLSTATLHFHKKSSNSTTVYEKKNGETVLENAGQDLFTWKADNYSGDNTYEKPTLQVKYGTIRATDAATQRPVSVTYQSGADNTLSFNVKKEKCGDRDAYYLDFDWIAPDTLMTIASTKYNFNTTAFGIHFSVYDDRHLEYKGGGNYAGHKDFYVRDLVSANTISSPYFSGQMLADVTDSTQIGMMSTSVVGTACVQSYKTFIGTKEYQSDTYAQGNKYVCTINLPQCDSTRTVNAEVTYYLNLDPTGLTTRVLRTKEPQIIKPLHAIKYTKFGEFFSTTSNENTGYNNLKWGFDWPDHEDFLTVDYFAINRAYKEDFSDATLIGYVPVTSFSSYDEGHDDEYDDTSTVPNSVRKVGYFEYLDATDAATYTTEPATEGKTYNITGLTDEEYSALSGTNTNDKTILETMRKKYFDIPERKVYYSIERTVLSSMYGSNKLPSTYKQKSFVYKTQQLPAVTEVSVAKTSTWDRSHNVTVGITLRNPYIQQLPEFAKLSTATKQQLVQQAKNKGGWKNKLYTWDKRASIVLKRYAAYKEDFSDAIVTIDTIDGGQVSYNADSTAFYTEYTDAQDRAYTYYKYEAYVDGTFSYYPLLIKDAIQPSDYNVQDYYYTVSALAKTINASKGYYSDNIFVSWQKLTGTKSAVELYRRPTGTNDWGQPIKTITDDTNYYRDRDGIEAGKWYDYKLVVSYNHENGQVYTSEATASGCTSSYGEVSGRVTLQDGGTAMSGVAVTATPNKTVTVRDGALSLPVASILNKQLLTMQSVDDIKLADGYTVQYWAKSIPTTVSGVSMQPTNNLVYIGDDEISMDGEGKLSVNGKEATKLAAKAPTADYLCITITKEPGGETKMYVDTTLVGTVNSGALTKKSAAITIASNWHLDEMRLWNKPLSQEKVLYYQTIMLGGREDNLAAYYRFDEDAKYAGGYCADLAYQTASDTHHHDLRMMNGTDAVTDVSTLEQMTDDQGMNTQALAKKVATSADGSYLLGGLPVSESVTYTITPSAGGQTAFQNTATKEASVTKDMSVMKNSYSDVNFECTTSVIFSGRVLYENSTIPVRDAYFLINGEEVVSTNNTTIKTDQNGEFRFAVPTVNMTFQVVKDGHHFVRNGYVYRNGGSESETRFVPSADYIGIELWDSTRVRLAGRVVGGTVQSAKILGVGTAKNNLGDNITLTMALEGDNTSNLFYLTDNTSVTEMTDSTTYVALPETDAATKDNPFSVKTKVKYERQRITITPDPRSGEFYIDLFPVKYKITQAYAQGYSTLFSSGETSQVLDLSQAINKNIQVTDTVSYNGRKFNVSANYDATYQRVYHSPVSLTYQQMNAGIYAGPLGDLVTDMATVSGTTDVISSVEYDDNNMKYVYGYPVFSNGEKYTIKVSAHEDFYYNNDKMLGTHDQVPVGNCALSVQNGMSKKQPVVNATMQQDGTAVITLQVDNTDFSSVGEAALKTINMDIDVDNYHYSAEPIKGYVLGAKVDGTDIANDPDASVQLLDILRDPPGTGSYSYVSAGSTYSIARNFNISGNLNLNVSFEAGQFTSPVVGTIYGGTVLDASVLSLAQMDAINVPIPLYSINLSRNASYTLTLNDRISTSSSATDVGADADVFIGTTNNLVVARTQSVCTIDSAMYNRYKGAIDRGTIKIITNGTNSKGEKYYLAVVSQLASVMSNPVTYAYTQGHIIKKLVPSLFDSRNALLLCGDSVSVQKLADQRKEVLYWSKVQPGEEGYGTTGYYSMIIPTGFNKIAVDKVNNYNNRIQRWWGLVAFNEKSKVNALLSGSPYATYSVSGNVPVSHDESEVDSDNKPDYNKYNITHSVFGVPIPLGLSGELERFQTSVGLQGAAAIGSQIFTGVGNGAISAAVWNKVHGGSDAAANQKMYQQYLDLLEKNTGKNKPQKKTTSQFAVADVKYVFSAWPSIDNFTWTTVPSYTASNTKTTGYCFAADGDSYFDVSVYRTPADSLAKNSKVYESLQWITESQNQSKYLYISDYVFSVSGGATRPWLKPDTTMFYQTGTPLSGQTLKIDNPKITVSKPVVSNIPQDDKAVFYVTMTNDSELPESSKLTKPSTFILSVVDATNTEGAKITMDGQPLTSGRTFVIAPHTSLTKTIEVERGQKYDYENIGLSLSTSNYDLTDVTPISVHYMPTSSPVKITAPTTNWTMNTLSPHDTIGYYIPMVIDGFNQNYDGFDHIEIQYKQSTQSDDDWVNLCSYFADDSLYNAASGNKAMITSGRITDYRFYGERDPMEMKYDLRAVAFSRIGTSFVTRSSDIVTGTKDTRPPRIIGTPKPTNGIIGTGEFATLAFTEQIAYNYLDKTSNFDIYGAFNGETTINNTSALYFPGKAEQSAATTVKRNLNGRSFSVDMLVTANEANRDQVLFTHGTGNDRLVFSINKSNQLQAKIGDNVYVGKAHEATEWTGAMSHVGLTVDSTRTLKFFCGNDFEYDDKGVISYQLPEEYVVNDYIYLGSDAPAASDRNNTLFAGRMLETRLWSKALSAEEVSKFNQKCADGYSYAMVAHWPLTQVSGTTAEETVAGAALQLNATQWSTRQNFSLAINNKAEELNSDYMGRNNSSDYTLSFWYKVQERAAGADSVNIFSSRKTRNDDATQRYMRLQLKKDTLVFKSGLNDFTLQTGHDDTQWHHFALTVNRSSNIATVYLDDNMVMQESADKVNGIATDYVAFGDDNMKGRIDQLQLWDTALPADVLAVTANASPKGTETGLLVYLPFERSAKSSQGLVTQVFSKYNEAASTTTANDVVMLEDATATGDNTDWAPVRNSEEYSKLDFDWSSDGTNLYIYLTTPLKNINKQQVYFSVRDVKDINGNPMAAPQMWTMLVDCNQVRWDNSDVVTSLEMGKGEVLAATYTNKSGSSQNVTFETDASWIELGAKTNVVAGNTQDYLTFSIKEGLNPGIYVATINVIDANGLVDPLTVTATVTAEEPTWEVDRTKYNESMNLIGRVYIKNGDNEVIDYNPLDIVGAFTSDGECVGKTYITVDANLNTGVYLTIYGNSSLYNKEVNFRLWRADKGYIVSLSPNETITFKPNALYGTQTPVRLVTQSTQTQILSLQKGWNWISLNVKPQAESTLNTLFANNKAFAANDQIVYANGYAAFDGSKWSTDQIATLSIDNVYQVYVNNAGQYRVIGSELTSSDMAVKLAGKAWSSLPYRLTEITPIATAMADYQLGDKASVGDVIKSLDQFAVLSENNTWVGSLQNLTPGVGYFIKRSSANECTVDFSKVLNSTTRSAAVTSNTAAEHADAMPVIAVFNTSDFDVQQGDKLVAYSEDGDVAGTAEEVTLPDGTTRYFLTANAEKGATLSLAQVRGSDIVASATNTLTMDDASVIGTLANPYVVTLAKEDIMLDRSNMPVEMNVIVECAESTEVTIELYDYSGQKEYSVTETAHQGRNVFAVPMTSGTVKVISVRLANGRTAEFKVANN